MGSCEKLWRFQKGLELFVFSLRENFEDRKYASRSGAPKLFWRVWQKAVRVSFHPFTFVPFIVQTGHGRPGAVCPPLQQQQKRHAQNSLFVEKSSFASQAMDRDWGFSRKKNLRRSRSFFRLAFGRRRSSWSPLHERSETKMFKKKYKTIKKKYKRVLNTSSHNTSRQIFKVFWKSGCWCVRRRSSNGYPARAHAETKVFVRQNAVALKCEEMRWSVEHCWCFRVLVASVGDWKKWNLRFGIVWKSIVVAANMTGSNVCL